MDPAMDRIGSESSTLKCPVTFINRHVFFAALTTLKCLCTENTRVAVSAALLRPHSADTPSVVYQLHHSVPSRNVM